MTSASFAAMATVEAQILRSPGKDGEGKVGGLIVHIASLKCLPLDVLTDGEIVNQPNLGTPQIVRQTYTQEPEKPIEAGYQLKVGDIRYQIRAVEDWYWPPDTAPYLKLTLNDIKTRP